MQPRLNTIYLFGVFMSELINFKSQKMLLVSQFQKSSDNYCYAEFLKKLAEQSGFELETFDCKINYFFLGPKSSDQLWWPLKLASNFVTNLAFLLKTLRTKQNIIFLVKGENINFRLLKILKWWQNFKLINFYPDSPFSVANTNSSYNILRSLPLYDRFAIWSKLLAQVLQASGSKEVFYWPFLCDEQLFAPAQSDEQMLANNQIYASDVCFVGSHDAKREKYLTKLLEREPQLNLKIWGDGWNKNLAQTAPLKYFVQSDKALTPEKMRLAFLGAKIVLNFLREQNVTSHNMRTFEVTSCAAFLLTERSQEQAQELFFEDETVACFASPEELHKKVVLYLTMDNLRQKIASAGFKRSTQLVKSIDLFKDLTQF